MRPHEPNRDTVRPNGKPVFLKDSRRKGASQGDALAHLGRKDVNRAEIICFEFRVVGQDVPSARPRSPKAPQSRPISKPSASGDCHFGSFPWRAWLRLKPLREE